jgi:hypothetical protein
LRGPGRTSSKGEPGKDDWWTRLRLDRAAFFPNTTIRHIFKVLNAFDRYDEFYNPSVLNAKLLDKTKNGTRFSMVVSQKTAFVNTAIESEYSSETTCLDERHCYNIIYSTRIQQIENYKDQGFLWRLYSIQRYEEQDGGVYAELESIVLSRDIPLELRWLMKPILQNLPRNSMIGTLEETRSAVCASGGGQARQTNDQRGTKRNLAASSGGPSTNFRPEGAAGSRPPVDGWCRSSRNRQGLPNDLFAHRKWHHGLSSQR